MQHRPFDIEGFVLVGGASRRMGTNKCLLHIDGVSLVSRVAGVLAATTARVRLVGKEPTVPEWSRVSEQDKIQVPFVADVYRTADGASPRSALTGLHAALWHARTAWVAVIACDLPFVTSDFVERLSGLRAAREGIEAVIPVQPDGRRQPLCALYRRAPCLRRATEALDSGDHELNAFLRRLRTHEVRAHEVRDLPGARRFFVNLNTPDEYQQVTMNDE